MKSPLWSKVLGVLLGIFIGAGVTYAAVHYSYHVEAVASVEVGEGPTEFEPGLSISPTTLDFGKIYPNTGPGSDHMSEKIALNVTNIGDVRVSLKLTVDNVPETLGVQADDLNNMSFEPGTEPGTRKITMSGHAWKADPGETYVLYIYVIAQSTTSPGSYDFKVIVTGH